jgi:hypothetical protein
MTDLVIVADDVHLVRATESEIFTGAVGEAGTAGMYYRLNTTTGKLEKGNASSTTELGEFGGILIDDARLGQAATIALDGAIVDLGDALDALDYGDAVYVDTTDATLADTPGTENLKIGVVVPGWASTTADKLLRVEREFTPVDLVE